MEGAILAIFDRARHDLAVPNLHSTDVTVRSIATLDDRQNLLWHGAKLDSLGLGQSRNR